MVPSPVPPSPLRILHVLAPAPYGGLERVVQCLATAQVEAGHRVEVAAVGAEEDGVASFLSWFRKRNVPARHIRVPDRRYLRERRLIRDVYSKVGPDIVHTHGYRCDVLDSGVARSMGIPTVTTVHGFTGEGLKGRVYEWLQRRAFRRFDAVIAVARPQIRMLRANGVARHLIHVIPNALDPESDRVSARHARERLGAQPEVFHIGWVGRLSPEKGPDIFLDALIRLGGCDFVASVIGSGAMGMSLTRQAREAGLDDKILWHGPLPNASSVFSAFDVLVMSSRREGTPMVLLEAMHAGLPIVATRVGGIPDVVSSEEAFLVDPEDPSAIAAALKEIRLQPGRARARARAAQDRVRSNFTVGPWVERHDSVYREVLGS